ncbi:HDIG domain-containing metalloprotein [Caproiciproducens sp. LBM24188]
MNQADLFQEMDSHLQEDETPSVYINRVSEEPIFREQPFFMLIRLKNTEQSKKYHPEGNAWNHTMLVVDEAAKEKGQSRNPRALLWAALLHDIGKPDTTRMRRGKITSYNHEKVGAKLAREFLAQLTDDTELIQSVAGLVRWHMQVLFVTGNLPFADLEAMKQETDYWEVALLGFCDRMGRLDADRAKEQENIKLFLQRVGE